MKERIDESELVLNERGAIYHLDLFPHEIAETIITVGDPNRVVDVSKHFDSVIHKASHREFVTHTGMLNNKRLSVMSTGMGAGCIDIFMNELDALVNIDFATRQPKTELSSLQLIRLGTSGSVSEEVEIDSILISGTAIGMDGLLDFYEHENSIHETVYLEAFASYIKPKFSEVRPYIASAGEELLKKFEGRYKKGTTVTAVGFYAPQGRRLRLQPQFSEFVQTIHQFRHKHFRITNLEMETAAIYGMGKLLGHQCLSVNAILANRINHTFSSNPKKIIEKMIEEALEIITVSG